MSAHLAPRSSTLGRLQQGDLDAVLGIEAQCYSHPWTRGNFVDSLVAGYLAWTLRDSGGELLGYLLAQPGVDEMHLLNLTVAPRWQRVGHAGQLLGHLYEECRRRGLLQIWLEVRQSNLAARALYARHGFTEAGLRPRYYPAADGREDALVMRKELAP